MSQTRFHAVTAFLGVDTSDGRCLMPLPEGMPLTSDLPLPVVAQQEITGRTYRTTVSVGYADTAYVDTANHLHVAGVLYDDHTSQAFARLLARGKRWMELNMDRAVGRHEFGSDDPMTEDVRFVMDRWRVRALYVGKRPCWDLPPVQVTFP
jgi:hypothetical protein